MSKPIDKTYLQNSFKSFDKSILENKYSADIILSKEEYLALSEEEKNNGKTYYIYDLDGGFSIPTSLPANGGNADTVNNHTVEANVPADAKFTDTIYTLPIATASSLGGIKSGGDISINSAGAVTVNSVNGHTVGINVPANAKFTDTTYSNATIDAAGLMSAADKKKLNYQMITDKQTGSLTWSPTEVKTTTVQISGNYGLLRISESYQDVNKSMFAFVEPLWWTGKEVTGTITWFIKDITNSYCVNSVQVITRSSSLKELIFTSEQTGFPGTCNYAYYNLSL